MAEEAAVPAGFWARVQKMIDDGIAAFARSGFLRNASITGGAGLTIADGGALALKAADGTIMFFIGPVVPAKSDGSPQPGWTIRRADGTVVLEMRDAFPSQSGGALRQALNWFDRSGNVVLADDTNSAQGVARPYVGGSFYRARNGDWIGTSSTAFETLFRAKLPKQHPQLYVRVWAANSVSGSTGEVRVMVNGVQLGQTGATAFSPITEYVVGPAAVVGGHLSELVVEIQARMVAGTGVVQVEPSSGPLGQQS